MGGPLLVRKIAALYNIFDRWSTYLCANRGTLSYPSAKTANPERLHRRLFSRIRRYDHVAYTFDLGNSSGSYVDISQRWVYLNHLKPGRGSWPRNVAVKPWLSIRSHKFPHGPSRNDCSEQTVFRLFICSWRLGPNRTSSVLQGPSIQGVQKRNNLINQQSYRGWFWPLLPPHSLWFLCRLRLSHDGHLIGIGPVPGRGGGTR